MRLATYLDDGQPLVGIVDGDRLLDPRDGFERLHGSPAPESMLAVIAAGGAMLDKLRAVRDEAMSGGNGAWRDLAKARLLAPIPRPTKNVYCVGRNYKLHIEEGARAHGVEPSYPAVPEFFTKPTTAVVGPDADVRWDPAATQKLDYEVELAFVVGEACRDVNKADAASKVFGYTILNDISARDLQFTHGQWFKGKGLDTFCPIGPWIVTADEFGSPADHRITLRVNGETRQDSTTSDLVFDCDDILSSLSQALTLEPGDIVCTGTPSGVALGMDPQVWLADGDVMEAEIEGIGVLRNTVRRVG